MNLILYHKIKFKYMDDAKTIQTINYNIQTFLIRTEDGVIPVCFLKKLSK